MRDRRVHDYPVAAQLHRDGRVLAVPRRRRRCRHLRVLRYSEIGGLRIPSHFDGAAALPPATRVFELAAEIGRRAVRRTTSPPSRVFAARRPLVACKRSSCPRSPRASRGLRCELTRDAGACGRPPRREHPAGLGRMVQFFRWRSLISGPPDLSARSTRRSATVTISAPDASMARSVSFTSCPSPSDDWRLVKLARDTSESCHQTSGVAGDPRRDKPCGRVGAGSRVARHRRWSKHEEGCRRTNFEARVSSRVSSGIQVERAARRGASWRSPATGGRVRNPSIARGADHARVAPDDRARAPGRGRRGRRPRGRAFTRAGRGPGPFHRMAETSPFDQTSRRASAPPARGGRGRNSSEPCRCIENAIETLRGATARRGLGPRGLRARCQESQFGCAKREDDRTGRTRHGERGRGRRRGRRDQKCSRAARRAHARIQSSPGVGASPAYIAAPPVVASRSTPRAIAETTAARRIRTEPRATNERARFARACSTAAATAATTMRTRCSARDLRAPALLQRKLPCERVCPVAPRQRRRRRRCRDARLLRSSRRRARRQPDVLDLLEGRLAPSWAT